MLYKCNFCDPKLTREMKEQGLKPIKTIDTDYDEYLKDEKGKYYHVDCYRQHLRKRKKMNEEDIELKVEERIEISKIEVLENEKKREFLNWVMDFYDGSLPTYFLKKLQMVREGTYEGLREPIDYETLTDIYSYMANYLNKIAAKKKLKSAQRMNYDLAVVIGNYNDYKAFKERQKKNSVDKVEIDKHTAVTEKVKKAEKIKKKDEFDITDFMDELLL